MQPVFDFMARSAAELDFDTAAPVKFLALPRDLYVSDTQAQAPVAAGVAYARRDRFLAPYVGAYSALMRSGLPVVTLHRPRFEEELDGFRVLVLANVALMSDAQVEAVRRFVREGGGLIATHETSICDERGAAARILALRTCWVSSTRLRARRHLASCVSASNMPCRPVRQLVRRWFMMNRWSWLKRSARKPSVGIRTRRERNRSCPPC